MKSLRISSLIVALALSLGAFAQDLIVDSCYVVGQLENGLKYYLRPNDREPGRANFHLAIKVGAVQEADGQNGLAHFLEHIAFDGSKHFRDGGIISYCESIGVKFGENLNAHTFPEKTVYDILNVPVTRSSTVDSCLLILSDFGGNLELSQSAIEKERGVVTEEWRLRSDAWDRLGDELFPILVNGSKYGFRRPIGNMEVINNFDRKELENFYHTWYRPNLEAVIVSGDIDVAYVEKKIKQLFGPMRNPKNEVPYEEYLVPDNEDPIYVTARDADISFANINVFFKHSSFPSDKRNTVDYVMHDFMSHVVAMSLNQRLMELRSASGNLLLNASASYEKYQGLPTSSSLSLYGTAELSHDVDAVRMLLTEVKRVHAHGFNMSELNRNVNEYLETLSRQNFKAMPNAYYTNQCIEHFIYGDPLCPAWYKLMVITGNLDYLGVEDFHNHFCKLTPSIGNNFICFGMYPDRDDWQPRLDALEQAAGEGASAETEPYVDMADGMSLVPELPAPVKVLREESAAMGYKKWVLPNGANVFYKHTEFAYDQIRMSARSKGGNNAFKDEDLVFARMVEGDDGSNIMLMDYLYGIGLGKYTEAEMNKLLMGKSTMLTLSTGKYVTTLVGHSVPRDLRTLFEEMHVWFGGCEYGEEEFERARLQLKKYIQQKSTDVNHVFNDSVKNTVYVNRPMLKSEDLDKISYEQLQRVFKEYYQNAGNYDFYFTGYLDEDSLRAYVEQYIAPLPGVREQPKDVDRLRYAEGQVEKHYTQPMQNPISWIFVNWHSLVPYSTKNELLAKAISSALNERYTRILREERQAIYAVSAATRYDVGMNDRCMVMVICPVKVEFKDEALSVLLNEMEDIAKNGITSSELMNFKEFELKEYNDKLKNNEFWEEAVFMFNERGVDEVTDYDKTINSITSDDVKDFVRKTLLKNKNRVVVNVMPFNS